MKQIRGQMDIFQYLSETPMFMHCGHCVCSKCLYHESGRCPYGCCFDDKRARTDPYDKAHPDRPPRTAWSNWDKPGEQAHWCRGGFFYPTSYCGNFVKYKGAVIEECIGCNICVFQDGYVSCSLKETMGCEACISQSEGKNVENVYDCQYMTDSGCGKLITAKNRILDAIAAGEETEMCREQCCRGCTKSCGYRCGQ